MRVSQGQSNMSNVMLWYHFDDVNDILLKVRFLEVILVQEIPKIIELILKMWEYSELHSRLPELSDNSRPPDLEWFQGCFEYSVKLTFNIYMQFYIYIYISCSSLCMDHINTWAIGIRINSLETLLVSAVEIILLRSISIIEPFNWILIYETYLFKKQKGHILWILCFGFSKTIQL